MEYKIVIPEMFGWTQTPEKIEQMPVNQPYLLNDGTVMLISEDVILMNLRMFG